MPNFNAPNLSSYCDITNINDNCLVCINPPVLANAMALLHRDEENPQDLLNKLTRAGHVDAIWSGKKPYDWTFRKVFTNVITNGMIRESIIPLLVTVSAFYILCFAEWGWLTLSGNGNCQ